MGHKKEYYIKQAEKCRIEIKRVLFSVERLLWQVQEDIENIKPYTNKDSLNDKQIKRKDELNIIGSLLSDTTALLDGAIYDIGLVPSLFYDKTKEE